MLPKRLVPAAASPDGAAEASPNRWRVPEAAALLGFLVAGGLWWRRDGSAEPSQESLQRLFTVVLVDGAIMVAVGENLKTTRKLNWEASHICARKLSFQVLIQNMFICIRVMDALICLQI